MAKFTKIKSSRISGPNGKFISVPEQEISSMTSSYNLDWLLSVFHGSKKYNTILYNNHVPRIECPFCGYKRDHPMKEWEEVNCPSCFAIHDVRGFSIPRYG